MNYKESLRVLGLTQVEFARRLGCSLPSLNQWLNGYRQIPSDIEMDLQKAIIQAKAEKMQELQSA